MLLRPCSLWPSLENKLGRDLALMASGRDARDTEAVGTDVSGLQGLAEHHLSRGRSPNHLTDYTVASKLSKFGAG
jgi:hypothetical protein